MNNWLVWFKGLLAAAINSASTTITTMVVAPESFNINEGLNKVFAIAGVSALLGVAFYLKRSPLPGITNPQ